MARARCRSNPRRPTTGGRSAGTAGCVSISALAIAGHAALVGEVVEVRDLAALVEHEARAGRGARHAAVHRSRLHHEIVVGPVEGVGTSVLSHEPTESPSMSPATTRSSPGIGSPPPYSHCNSGLSGICASRPGNLAGSARRGATAQKVDELRARPADARQLEAPLQHRQVGIEPLARRAACRAPGRPRARTRSTCMLLGLRLLHQRLQVGAVLGVVARRRSATSANSARSSSVNLPAQARASTSATSPPRE